MDLDRNLLLNQNHIFWVHCRDDHVLLKKGGEYQVCMLVSRRIHWNTLKRRLPVGINAVDESCKRSDNKGPVSVNGLIASAGVFPPTGDSLENERKQRQLLTPFNMQDFLTYLALDLDARRSQNECTNRKKETLYRDRGIERMGHMVTNSMSMCSNFLP